MAELKTKAWYQSKGVWAGIITVFLGAAAGIAKQFGVDLAALPWYPILIGILGALGLYSRVTADTTIK